ncbi:hypothetical protein TUM19329_30170 [Legionella antarctica]|uniref:Ketosynthase family 3 (KS3) domain-containing protein n=1 Tax=Legionella antarctica TaxID=2708020 RepID=A0A6F8T9J5_9GAMM|nr:polyketide synthase [Legionella antarctica]BCA96656.1 hypothetical protein TUM19329_30170 [Legionella antarctica]
MPESDYPKTAIAVVGMGCKLPGADNIDEFWQLLEEGVDAISDIPASRWDIIKYYDEHFGTLGKTYQKQGGFVKNIEYFDAGFFSISKERAKTLDPQQRMILEVSWQAFESGCLVPERYRKEKVGVYLGIGSLEYALAQLHDADNLDFLDFNFLLHNDLGLSAARISGFYGFTGPSYTFNSTCASSFVALHTACQHLQQGEIPMALVSGVNFLGAPFNNLALSQGWILSPSSRCRSFDANADGYVRSEGCAVVILKRLDDALNDGDNIMAIIRGSAMNQDGLRSDFAHPTEHSRQTVIKEALQAAKCDAQTINYVEAHGFGTVANDANELRVIADCYARNRNKRNTCYVGAVKTNIGYLEYASGIASLVKVILSMHHQTIPAHLHLQELCADSGIVNDDSLKISLEKKSWQRINNQPLRAAINNYSLAGTNIHVIVEEAPVLKNVHFDIEGPSLFLLSAKNIESLQRYATDYLKWLARHPEIALSSLCYLAACGRSHFNYRQAFIINSHKELIAKLQTFRAGDYNQIKILSNTDSGVHLNMPGENRKTLDHLAKQFMAGVDVNWQAIYVQDKNQQKLVLPGYPFDKKYYWYK